MQTVNVAVGERVRQGQVLLRLDERIYAGRVDEAAAMVARNKEDAAEAQRDLKRVQELYDRTVISVSELDQAKLRQARAAAQLKESQARQRQEQKNREDTLLRAPFDAVVVARQVEPGQAVAATLQPQSLLVVARAGEMLARAQVQETQLASSESGAGSRGERGQAAFSRQGQDHGAGANDTRQVRTAALSPGCDFCAGEKRNCALVPRPYSIFPDTSFLEVLADRPVFVQDVIFGKIGEEGRDQHGAIGMLGAERFHQVGDLSQQLPRVPAVCCSSPGKPCRRIMASSFAK